MSEVSAYATLKLTVENAPEVKGTVAYIVPRCVEWQVAASRFGGRRITWTRAVLTGPSRKGRWTGAAIYDYGDVPAWLPIPHEWIERASDLVAGPPVADTDETGEKLMEPLTEADFSMQYDAEHTFPFIEDENATIMAWGHPDPVTLAGRITEYDRRASGDPEAEATQPENISRVYAVMVEDGEEWRIRWGSSVSADTEGAFPVSIVSR